MLDFFSPAGCPFQSPNQQCQSIEATISALYCHNHKQSHRLIDWMSESQRRSWGFTALLRTPSWWGGDCCPSPSIPPPLWFRFLAPIWYMTMPTALVNGRWDGGCVVRAGVDRWDEYADDEERRRQGGDHAAAQPSLRMETEIFRLSTQSCRPVSPDHFVDSQTGLFLHP